MTKQAHIAALALAALVIMLTFAPAAVADADPASDVLPLQPVFFTYSSVKPSFSEELYAIAYVAGKHGFPLKVAVIASEDDLGAVPQLFDKPDRYAKFLSDEIAYNRDQPLLIVMPKGFGTQDLTAEQAALVDDVEIPKAAASDANLLVKAGTDAARKLVDALGVELPADELATARTKAKESQSPLGDKGFQRANQSHKQSGGVPGFVKFGAPVMIVAIGALAAALLARRRPADDEDFEDGDDVDHDDDPADQTADEESK